MTSTTGRKAVRKAKKTAPKKSAKRVAESRSASAPVDPAHLILCCHPGIKNITEINDQLVVAHSGNANIVVDAGKVESIDTAALQLLCAFTNSIRKESRSIEWSNTSSVFDEMADLADLRRCLAVGAESDAEDDGLCPVF